MKKKGCIEYIKSDLYRYSGSISFKSFIKIFVLESGFRKMIPIRMAQSQRGGVICILGKILNLLSRSGSMKINYKTKIGYGLYIGHGGPVIINNTAVIGNNCNISQFLTIGSNKGNAAIIGDNVYIGPSVCIVEDVKIGNNVTIGAGSVVTKDIPDNATACGNYAKVINYNNPARFIRYKWKIKDE